MENSKDSPPRGPTEAQVDSVPDIGPGARPSSAEDKKCTSPDKTRPPPLNLSFPKDLSVAEIRDMDKPDIRLEICKTFRQMQILEEQSFNYAHSCQWADVLKNDSEKSLLQFLGYVRKIPVAYAGFQMCPCHVLLWKYFFVLPTCRQIGIALPFGRELVRQLCRRLGPSTKLEITYNARGNQAMHKIMTYFGVKPECITGVVGVGEILKRRGDNPTY